MGAALGDAGGGDQGELGVLLEVGNAEGAAVAHGGADFGERPGHVVVQAAGIGHVGIDSADQIGRASCRERV